MQLGTMLAGVNTPTILAGQAQCPCYLIIGDAEGNIALNGIEVSIDGIPFVSINNRPLIEAFSQWQMEAVLSIGGLGNMLKIATGQIRKNTTIRLVNSSGVATPAIYGFSDGKDGIPIQATTKTINASSNETFEKFSALMIDVSGGAFSTAEIVFSDGHKETMTPTECNGLFALKYSCDSAAGAGTLSLGEVLVIDNTDQSIQSVKINTGVFDQTVLNVKLPDSAFQALKQ